MADGIITRQDLITDDALNFGREYSENIKTIIESNEAIKKSAKEVFDIYKQFDKISTQDQFIEAKRRETLATLEAKNAIKLQEEALKSAERIKRESIRTDVAVAKGQKVIAVSAKTTSTAWKEQDQAEKALLSTKRKNQLASESTNRALIAEREQLRQQNLEIKRSLTFMGQLTAKRDQARKSIQEYQAKLALGKSLSDREQQELRESTREFEKYDGAIRNIRQSTGQFQENVGNYPKLFRSVGAGIKSLIPALGVIGAINAAFSVIKDATKTVREFDRQIIAVQKTTGLADDDIRSLKNEIIDLGLELKGVSIQGLAESAEVAGQLGVQGTKNILGFAKAVEILKISAKGINEETVADFAKFIEVSKDSAENADRLSSVITDLGNNFATTEKEIINSSIEIQKGVQIYDVAAEQVLGLAGATTSLGIQDAAARTSIRKTFSVIQQAIFTGKNLTEVLEITGLTQEELSKQFEKDATGTFIKFLQGLDGITQSGGNTQAILEKMKLSGDRVAPTLLSLASKNELVADAVERANDEYITNTAALNEAETASKSLDVIIGDLGDSWDGLILSIESGDGAISSFFKGVIEFLDGAVQGMILFNESFDDMIGRVSNSQEDFSFGFELDFINSLDTDEAEAYAIRQLDRTDEQLENEEKKLAVLREQRDELQAASVFSGARLFTSPDKFDDEIESSARQVALLQGRLRAYEQTLGITDDAVVQNTANLKDNTGETVRNVAFLRAAIKAQRDKLELTTSRDEASVIQANIQGLKDELNAILGTTEATSRKKKVVDDLYKLQEQRIKNNISIEKDLVKSEDDTINNKLISSAFLFAEEVKLLELQRDKALELAKGRADEETRIREQFIFDYNQLTQERVDNDEKILTEAFNRAKARIEETKRLQESGTSADAAILKDRLTKELNNEELTIEQKLLLQEQYEEDLRQLKLNSAIINLQAQIDSVQAELQLADLSFEHRKNLEIQLATLKNALTDAQLAKATAAFDDEAKLEQELLDLKKQKIAEASQVIADSLGLDAQNIERLFTGLSEGFESALDAIGAAVAVAGDIVNAVYQANIDNLDNQIAASEEYYDRQYALAEGDRDQQDAIRAEQELKRQALEAKKRKEKQKQAKAQKAFSIFEIGINTAVAIMQAYAQLGPIAGSVAAVLIGVLGLAQIAAVAARPIPKYAEGTQNHPGGPAEVAENVPEVIKEPGKKPYIQKNRAILDLPKGTKVFPSVDEYNEMENRMLLSSFNNQLSGILSYQNIVTLNSDNTELVEEMRLTRKTIKESKTNVRIERNVIDIPHAMFANSNIDWDN